MASWPFRPRNGRNGRLPVAAWYNVTPTLQRSTDEVNDWLLQVFFSTARSYISGCYNSMESPSEFIRMRISWPRSGQGGPVGGRAMRSQGSEETGRWWGGAVGSRCSLPGTPQCHTVRWNSHSPPNPGLLQNQSVYICAYRPRVILTHRQNIDVQTFVDQTQHR